MYALYGKHATINGTNSLVIERIVNTDYVEAIGDCVIVDELPPVPEYKPGFMQTAHWDFDNDCYAFTEMVVALSIEDKVAQLELEDTLKQERIDDLTMMLLELGGALVG